MERSGKLLSEKQRIYQQLLALRCRRGEREAWEELIRLWQPRLFYYVRRLVPQEQDAWDVLQQTWLGAFQNIGTLNDPKLLAPWLYRIARNKTIGQRRMRFPKPMDVPEDRLTEDRDETIAFDNAELVHEALDKLELVDREVLTLQFLRDLSVDEIADVLEIPAGTVKSRLFHARRALKEVLAKEAAL